MIMIAEGSVCNCENYIGEIDLENNWTLKIIDKVG